MKTYGEVELQLHTFLTSVVDEDEWTASGHGRFTPREKAPSAHWIRCVDKDGLYSSNTDQNTTFLSTFGADSPVEVKVKLFLCITITP